MANPHVRRNAATLFVEAFPLQDPSLALGDLDALLQKQFDALHALLKDDAVPVRVVAVQGVCRVLAHFWELIPAPTAKALLLVLCRDLAHDAAANTVRTAVFQGLRHVTPDLTPRIPRYHHRCAPPSSRASSSCWRRRRCRRWSRR